jgi:Spy/CpxP family protein refolding chaperone
MTPLVRKLVIALAVSVALNLFGFGFLVARGLRHREGPMAMHGPGMHPPAGLDFGPRRMMRGVRELGPNAAEFMDARREAMRAHHRALRDAQDAVNKALTAEPFAPAALAAALADLRARQSAAAQAAHGALVELATKLDASQRRMLAEHGRGMPAP